MKTTFQTHDLNLPAWGPYTKKYSGISHIPDANDGCRFDLSVFPGLYRRRVDVPNVLFESGYHMWQAAPDLSCYTMRHELQWQDQLYADVSFFRLDACRRLIRVRFCNHTDTWQNGALHYMASAWDPVPSGESFAITGGDISLPDSAAFVLARDYEDLVFAVRRPTDNLVYNGLRRAEEPVEGFLSGYGIGHGFGAKGDYVRFRLTLPVPLDQPYLGIRYVNGSGQSARFVLSTGDELCLPQALTPTLVFIPLSEPMAAGDQLLTLTAAGTGSARLDCLVLCRESDIPRITMTPRGAGACPELKTYADEGFLTLHYPHIAEHYGIMWDFADYEIRQILSDELDIFLPAKVHNHVDEILQGNGRGHFTNVFFRPIPLAPGETKVIWGMVCHAGTSSEAAGLCRRTRQEISRFPALWEQASTAMAPVDMLPEGQLFALGQQLMQAVLSTNVVYPVYTRSQYIRHNTPGRTWDSLYTWDSGFIGMGLTQLSLQRGFDCLNAYLTAPGDDEAAFIHHGSLVPTQFYLYNELWNRTCSRELAEYCYPRLKQYYDFIRGSAGSSTTNNLKSGLLRPWDYFYNSGGWDDYPPQKALHGQKLEACCTPVITTAHVIRCARILAHTAALLGHAQAARALLADAEELTRVLDRHAWDEEAGYFSYVLHDEQGNPREFFRHESGMNYNMGLGGASPLFANACTAEQRRRLWQKLESGQHLLTDCGLSTVDQSAPYFRRDGYWNGAVWMPYQWLFFKAALDEGRLSFAWSLAQRLLDLWQRECAASYHCFEHFMIESRRGAGWHQFSGLSSPIVQFFAAYYRPGTLTTGFDTFVARVQWGEAHRTLHAELQCTRCGEQSVLAVTDPAASVAVCSAPHTRIHRRYPGLWEITFCPETPGAVSLRIS